MCWGMSRVFGILACHLAARIVAASINDVLRAYVETALPMCITPVFAVEHDPACRQNAPTRIPVDDSFLAATRAETNR